MLIYHRTNLLTSNAQTLVNTVNCVGVMGKGIAAEFKSRYPDMFKSYKRICDAGKLEVGMLWLWQGQDHWVLNFPTKKHWRYPSKIEWIEAGLEKFVAEYSHRGITDVSFPKLGCGNGGLKWDVVRPLMERYLAPLPINIYIHDFTVDLGLPEHLEDVARSLRSSLPAASSFEGFLENLAHVAQATAGKLTTLESQIPFDLELTRDDALRIKLDTGSYLIERDDVRALWVALSRGLVTRQTAEWSAAEAAEQILSIMAVLPGVRPVQIQRRTSSSPEIALEFEAPKGTTKVERDAVQLALEWA